MITTFTAKAVVEVEPNGVDAWDSHHQLTNGLTVATKYFDKAPDLIEISSQVMQDALLWPVFKDRDFVGTQDVLDYITKITGCHCDAVIRNYSIRFYVSNPLSVSNICGS